MNKPIKKYPSEPVFFWNEVADWIKRKHKRDVRDWASKYWPTPDEKAEYQDFWHWITDTSEISNGCFFWLSMSWLDVETTKPWIKEILTIIRDEFSEDGDDIKFWVSW